MSKIGKVPVPLPKGVEAKVDGEVFRVKGPKGNLSVDLHQDVTVTIEDGVIQVGRRGETKIAKAMHGTVRALVRNAVVGVSEGYTRKLEIVGVGYRAQLQGQKLVLNIGFCHTVEFEPPAGITFTTPDQTHIEITGMDKQLVGEMAANIRAARKPEPYKGKGIRYAGEQVRRKAGKSGK